ncbi:MAG: nucleotidyltransferase [Armatimonadetes bacterium CG17_big_fil_post_rev_8_21_14_2_50_66_6]|nr:MAG: nucleotidyltransferase [Armatimonadetes bacterium CG17_big_fil_post_rev_8_21_14_2_50_66_6]
MNRSSVSLPDDRIADFCRRHHVRKLSLFGSVLREDFTPDSDVDVLVEFEPDRTPGHFRLFDMEEELSNMVGGRKVDLRTSQEISRYFRRQVLDTAEVHYVAG